MPGAPLEYVPVNAPDVLPVATMPPDPPAPTDVDADMPRVRVVPSSARVALLNVGASHAVNEPVNWVYPVELATVKTWVLSLRYAAPGVEGIAVDMDMPPAVIASSAACRSVWADNVPAMLPHVPPDTVPHDAVVPLVVKYLPLLPVCVGKESPPLPITSHALPVYHCGPVGVVCIMPTNGVPANATELYGST